jgi:hypothetical protein
MGASDFCVAGIVLVVRNYYVETKRCPVEMREPANVTNVCRSHAAAGNRLGSA